MKPWIGDIEAQTMDNGDFRRVLFTGSKVQLVLMSLEAGEDIGEEVHAGTDQFFRVEAGRGEVVIDGNASDIESDMAIVVPAGARHNIRNTGSEPLRLYTLYAPPEHPADTVHHTRAEAEQAHHEHG